MKNKQKDKDFDLDRLEEIDTSLGDLPIDINKIIASYDYYNRSLGNLYKKVIKILNILNGKEMYQGGNLDFYSHDFAIQLLKRLSRNNDSNHSSLSIPHSFWNDLLRLLFKWVICMWQIIGSNSQLKEIIKEIESVKSFMFYGDILINIMMNLSKLKFMEQSDFSTFKALVDCEFMENPHLFPLFSNFIKDFYKGYDKGGKETISLCKELEIKYLNGNFDNDLILKFMIIIYDPKGLIRMECFPNDNHSLLSQLYPLISPTREYLEFCKFNGPKNLANPDPNYINDSIVEFLLLTNRTILIESFYTLVLVLRNLKESIELTGKILEKIIKFKNYNDRLHCWDPKIFKESLHKAFQCDYITKNEYDEYLILIKTSHKFNQSASSIS